MTKATEKSAPFAERLRAEELPNIVIRTFKDHYAQLVEGQDGFLSEADILPVGSLPDIEAFSPELTRVGQTAVSDTVLLKLNGGLGTSMGLYQAKSLLAVKEDLTFLDIAAQQAQHRGIPLVLMNSFATRDDSLSALSRYPDLHLMIWKPVFPVALLL